MLMLASERGIHLKIEIWAPGGEVRNHMVNRRGESTEGIPQGLKPFDQVATERAKAEALAYLEAKAM